MELILRAFHATDDCDRCVVFAGERDEIQLLETRYSNDRVRNVGVRRSWSLKRKSGMSSQSENIKTPLIGFGMYKGFNVHEMHENVKSKI